MASTPSIPNSLGRQQTEILFLSFSDPALPDISAMVEVAQTQMLEGRSTPIHFNFEYLDPSTSVVGPSSQDRAVGYLHEKYRGHRFRVVIAIGERALSLIEDTRGARNIFSGAAVVFAVLDPSDPNKLSSVTLDRTGVIRTSNFLATLQAALAQNPGTRRVVVVSGSSDIEKREVNRARAQFRPYESDVEFQYWTELKFREVAPRLASLNPDTVVLFLDFLRDAVGEQFVPAQILPSISSTSNRPIYGTYASFVGKGVVGGSVADLQEMGKIIGQHGLRILNGEKPENIPIAKGEFQRYIFDRRQLQRWRIAQDLLPPDSSVLYWQSSSWDLYGWRIVGLVTAIIIETLLIGMLLQSRASRKQAQETLHEKKEELSEAQRIAQLGSWQWDPQSDALTCTSMLHSLMGLPPISLTLHLKAFADFFSAGSWELWSQSTEHCLQTGEPYELELQAFRVDGICLWVAARGEAVRDKSGKVRELRGTIQNITERKEAEELRLRHAAIVESTDDAICSMNSAGLIVSWNRGAERMFGFAPPEVIGQSITKLVPSELHDDTRTILQLVQGGEGIEHYETTRITKDGKSINVSLTVSPVRDPVGNIVGCSEIARDITDHKRIEEELKKSEEKFSKVFLHSPLAITLTSARTHQYIDVNDSYVRLTGLRREEVIGRSALEIGVWVNSGNKKMTDRLLAGGSIRDVEYRFQTKDGKMLVVLTSTELIEIQGEPCVLTVVADVTARVQTEQALAESEKRFRLMADSAPVLMWMAGSDSLFIDVNKEWLRFTGRTLEQELGTGWSEDVHPDDRERCLRAYGFACESRRQFTIEYRLRRHDGQYRSIVNRGVPRFLEDGTFAGYVGCCIDISEEREAKAIQKELSGRLINAQEEERARIARELHDDINQRLAMLANGLQVLQQGSAESEQRQIQDLWQLTSDIATDVQHLSHSLHPSKLHYIGLPAAIRDACHEFARVHKLEVECSVHHPGAKLEEMISLTLYRVLQESLRNVAKHSHAHHVKVELNTRTNGIQLRISDDGIGFSGDHIAANQGLGLVSMRERLRLTGGELSIWSRPALGTQVEAIVPLVGTKTVVRQADRRAS